MKGVKRRGGRISHGWGEERGKGGLKVQNRLFGIRSSEHRSRQTFLEKR